MKQELVVHLRVYKGKQLTFDSKGKSTNENHLVHLAHNTTEWKKYLSYLHANGIIKVEVEKVLDLNKMNQGKEKSDPDYYQEVEDFESIQSEVDKVMNPEGVIELTADQKRIADLEATVEKLLAKGNDSDPDDSETTGPSEELKAARVKYEELFGKKGGPKWTLEEINQKIEEFKPIE